MATPEPLTSERLEEIVGDFAARIPFNSLLGLSPLRIDDGCVSFSFDMREALIGHPFRKFLHGGVISSCLDVAGGMAAFLAVLQHYRCVDDAVVQSVLARLATIDMRVDYLRPGQGESFVAKAQVVRAGKKVAVTRMELCNEAQTQLAVGTATYIVG